MFRKVPPKIYWPATSRQVEAQMRQGKVPAAFVRRMRTINMLSATTLMKIEDDFLLPFDVMDVHHVLDALISQDAIIDQIDSDELSYALTTGNIHPLREIAETNPLLLKGFTGGWMNLFINEPFDPLCVMLAMRAKAMLDLVDEEGKSYNLIRKLGFGFIDFGEIEGEEPGDPGDYYPPAIDNPIGLPEAPGPAPPGPDDPGYTPPAPMPGEPGGGDGGGTGGSGAGSAPWGFGSGAGDLGGAVGGGRTSPPVGGDPCADVDNPEETITMGYTTQQMQVDEEQELTVVGAHPRWSYENYHWEIASGGGELSTDVGFETIYTAPEENPNCENNSTINLICGGEVMASLTIAVNALDVVTRAVSIWTDKSCRTSGDFKFCKASHYMYKCNGDFYSTYDPCTEGEIQGTQYGDCEACYAKTPQYTLGCGSVPSSINYWVNGSPRDLRTEEMKTAGCCPEELL